MAIEKKVGIEATVPGMDYHTGAEKEIVLFIIAEDGLRSNLCTISPEYGLKRLEGIEDPDVDVDENGRIVIP